MSTATELDATIVAMSTALEETLLDGVAAFREGEVRATLEKAVEYARTRHDSLIAAGYARPDGRYEGWLYLPDETTRVYPGLTSQYLATITNDAIQARIDRTVFFQSSSDTKTEQDLKNLRQTLEILNQEIHPRGIIPQDRNTFEAARTTLNRGNIFRTTTRCCR
jgi:hypothetical protein